MKKKLVVPFEKMNGAGNDFIVIDNRFFHFTDEELSALAARWCPRRTGVGADGLLAFARPQDAAAHDYRMRYFNADGSRATMCGNGGRCLARFARDAGLAQETFVFESDAGVYRAQLVDEQDLGEQSVRLFVPPPQRFAPRFQLKSGVALPFIWTGTEHVVRFVEDAAAAPVAAEGRSIRQDAALAPAGANVNFVQVAEAGGPGALARLVVRTYEKGVEAETQACGTGALAAAVTARLTGRAQAEQIDVQMPGGRLRVGFRLEGEAVRDLYLEGPVAYTFRGTLEV